MATKEGGPRKLNRGLWWQSILVFAGLENFKRYLRSQSGALRRLDIEILREDSKGGEGPSSGRHGKLGTLSKERVQ